MKIKQRLSGIGLILIIAGLFLIVAQPVSMTGAVIDITTAISRMTFFMGIAAVIGGGILLAAGTKTESELEKIGNSVYEPHAIERMKKRGLLPSVIDSVIDSGENYELEDISDFGEAKGATQAYIAKDIADIMKGKGKRMIKIDPKRKRKYESVIVLTDDKNTIKTAYVANDKNLNWFLKKYTPGKDQKEQAA